MVLHENRNNQTGNTGVAILTNLPILLNSISLILHTIGIYLLCHGKVRKRNQDIIILNISISEIGMGILDMSQNIVIRYESLRTEKCYIIIANCCFFSIPFFFLIMLLTVDRFLEVYLNIKYCLYFTNKRKLALSIGAAWMVGVVTGFTLIKLKLNYDIKARRIIYTALFPTYESLFLTVAIVVYLYIYSRFRRIKSHSLGRISPIVSIKETNCENTMEQIKAAGNQKVKLTAKPSIKLKARISKRNFFAPFLIIVSFVIFVITPDMLNLTYFYWYSHNHRGSHITSNILLCLYAIGFIIDALVYIFLQRKVRKQFIQVFCKCKCRIADISSLRNSTQYSTTN